jgi:hypothetical protein
MFLSRVSQSLADTDWRQQRIPSLEYGIYAIGELEFAGEFADQTDPQVRRTLIQTKAFLTYRKQLTNLQTQEARLRRHRQQDEERLCKLQGDRKYNEFQAQRSDSAAAAAASTGASTKSGGFEFSGAASRPRTPIGNCPADDILTQLRLPESPVA